MRLVYTADLHGDITSYRALLDLAVRYRARAAIVGGDLLPHAIKLQQSLDTQRHFIDRQLRPVLEEFHRLHTDVAVYLLAGNDDWAAAITALEALELDGLAYPLHERIYALSQSVQPLDTLDTRFIQGSQHDEQLWLVGYACVPLTPFSIKDYERRDDGPLPLFDFGMSYSSWSGRIQPINSQQIAALPSIAEDLVALSQRSSPVRTIYVCHTPPYQTPLDQMHGGRHVGSHALRTFIEAYNPLLTLHGHIHEAPQLTGVYATQIGTTWCMNPGHNHGRFHAITLDTNDIAGTTEHTVFGRMQA